MVRQVTCVNNNNNNNNNVPIKCKEGKMLLAEEEQKARWMEHFQEVLNQPDLTAELDLGNDVPRNLLEVNMTDVTAAEVNQAVDSLTNNTAPDIDEILAQLLKHGKDVITGQLVVLFNSIWRELDVLDAWRKGIIVKLPKKGNLIDCNNWRGITQLSTHGKVFTRVLLNRLQDAVYQNKKWGTSLLFLTHVKPFSMSKQASGWVAPVPNRSLHYETS